ncbi:MAG TPA: hypothetical protein VFK05_28665 [Polyangiaceae bacterium]|nr:hypothetical protein [Polyangiaceae bacterium]
MAVAIAGALAIFSSRRRAWLATIALTGVLLLMAIVSLSPFAQQPYFSLRCATFAMALAAAAGQRRRWIAFAAGAGAVILMLVSVIWLIASGGMVTFVVGESVDPSQRAFVVESMDVTSGFVSTIIVFVLVTLVAFWTTQRPKERA